MFRVETMLTDHDLIGVLGRDITVTLVEISRSGCLLESPCALDAGTLGMLRLTTQGVEYSDAVRIARCAELPGTGGRFHIGAEFVWLDAPEPNSLRRLAAMYQDGGSQAVTALVS
jgi:hypothetical protein